MMWSREHSPPTHPHPCSGNAKMMTPSCMVLPTGQIQQFHDHLNSTAPSIKLTTELEQEGSLPFLDTRAMRHSDGSLTTTVFRKKTHSDWYLDFDSHHSLAHKVAVVQTLLTRAHWICSNIPDMDVETKQVAGALSNNGYPTGLVKRNWEPSPHDPIHLSLNQTPPRL